MASRQSVDSQADESNGRNRLIFHREYLAHVRASARLDLTRSRAWI
jgi:hypothetical protein